MVPQSSHDGEAVAQCGQGRGVAWILASLLQNGASKEKASSLFSSLSVLCDGSLCSSQQLWPLAVTMCLLILSQFGKCQQRAGLGQWSKLVFTRLHQSVFVACVLWGISGTTRHHSVS